MKKLSSFFKNNFLALILVGVTLFVCFQNYTPNAWLSGWDTLHPEFDFSLNFKRVLAGVWREEQGLGAVAAHTHMADLPRIIFLWLASVFLPASFLRYFFVFTCLVLGPLGIYWLVARVVGKNKFSFKLAGFLGGLFYLLNLGTLQQFYVPFEMFSTQFASLPWLFGLATLIVKKRDLSFKLLFWFGLVSFLVAPIAFAPHLWYAYFGSLVLYLGILGLMGKRKSFKKVGLILALTLLINSFWLLPNLYFLLTHAKDVPLAQTNRLFSEEAFLANKEYGNLKNTILLKNFLFGWTVSVIYLMSGFSIFENRELF